MKKNFKPTNPLVSPLLTDLYQLTMAYGYWKSGRHDDYAVFDLFIRHCPFGGKVAVFAGLEETLRAVNNFRFSDSDVEHIKNVSMPGLDPEFYKYLRGLDFSRTKIYAPREGTLVFPRIPLLRVEGPLIMGQLLETTALYLINYATLITTNAARMRFAAGTKKLMVEFGLRRAQGPDGGISASKYSYIGGFDGTSNVLAGKLFGIPEKGTMAHAFIQSFVSLEDVKNPMLADKNGKENNFIKMVREIRWTHGFNNTNEGELAAFIAYAQAFPNSFLALVDTYNTIESGVPNFICVATALSLLGYKPLGVRIDSGDLAKLSKEIRKLFQTGGQRYGVDLFKKMIFASNSINEKILRSLNEQEHEINGFGIGENLVTCQDQPALGGVYKLVEINGQPRIKISEDVGKITFPGKKSVYRLVGKNAKPIADIMLATDEKEPQPGEKVLCLDPFNEAKKIHITPSAVAALNQLVWDEGKVTADFFPLKETREYILAQLANISPDHLRAENPTPYNVWVSQKLSGFIHELLSKESVITELS